MTVNDGHDQGPVYKERGFTLVLGLPKQPSGLRLALVYKQISLVGLPYQPGQLYQLY